MAWKTDSAEVYLFILQAMQRSKNKAEEKTGWKLEVASVRWSQRGSGPWCCGWMRGRVLLGDFPDHNVMLDADQR